MKVSRKSESDSAWAARAVQPDPHVAAPVRADLSRLLETLAERCSDARIAGDFPAGPVETPERRPACNLPKAHRNG